MGSNTEIGSSNRVHRVNCLVLKITKHYKDFQGFDRKSKQCSKATMISQD